MPSLAFAAEADHAYAVAGVTDSTVSVNWDVVKTAMADDDLKVYVVDVVAPTHTEKGEVKLACMNDFCEEVKTVEINTIPHTMAQRNLSLEAYAEAMLAQEEFTNKEAADKWVRDHKNSNDHNCYVKNANVCTSCGYVQPLLDDSSIQAHATKTSCTDYVCDCGETIKADHNWVKGELATGVTATCAGTAYHATCSKCNAEGIVYDNPASSVPHNYGKTVDASEATKTVKDGTVNKKEVLEGYVALLKSDYGTAVKPEGRIDFDHLADYDFYKYNKVTEADCSSTPGSAKLVCVDCGAEVEAATDTIAAAHDYGTATHVAATCDEAGKNVKVCKKCGDVQTTHLTTTEPALGHSYKVTKSEATCGSDEYYTIVCTTCTKKCRHAHGAKVTYNTTTGEASVTKTGTEAVNTSISELPSKETTTTKTFAYSGFTADELQGTSVIELTFNKVAAPKHKYGKEVLLKEATCSTDELWGYKCTECGKIATHVVAGKVPATKTGTALGHDAVKTVVAPTCGTAGFYTEQCSRCGLYKQTADGSDVVDDHGEVTKTGWTKDIDKAIQTKNANPVVAKGAACKMDKWVVTKASTVFEEGVKTLTCSVCGAHDATKTIIAKKTVAKASNTVKAGKKSFNVKSSAANATGYRVYYKKAGAKSWKSYTKKTASLSKTFSGLSKGKYYVKVRAYAKNYDGDGQVVWGATSSTKSVKVK